MEKLVLIVPIKWHLAGHHHIEDHAHRPDVALEVVDATEDLGSNEVRRARNLLLPFLELACQTKINEFHRPIILLVLVEHYVLGFDVSVNDVFRVDVAEGAE